VLGMQAARATYCRHAGLGGVQAVHVPDRCSLRTLCSIDAGGTLAHVKPAAPTHRPLSWKLPYVGSRVASGSE
jgi:hypothetical protein